jgi:hypothetical protein
MRLFIYAGIVLVIACNRPAEESAAPVQRDNVSLESVRLPPEKGTQQISGLVTHRDGASVTLDSGGPNPIPIRIDDRTNVIIDGDASTAAQIHEGDLVRAAYRFHDGEPLALQVVANQKAIPTARITRPLPLPEPAPAKPLQR